MNNLNVNAIYIGEQIVDLQFQLPITICKGGNQLKQRPAAVRLKSASLAEPPATFLPNPPGPLNLSWAGTRKWRTEAFPQIFQAGPTIDWGRKKEV